MTFPNDITFLSTKVLTYLHKNDQASCEPQPLHANFLGIGTNRFESSPVTTFLFTLLMEWHIAKATQKLPIPNEKQWIDSRNVTAVDPLCFMVLTT